MLLNKHRLSAERGLPSPLCALPMHFYTLPIALSTVCNVRLCAHFDTRFVRSVFCDAHVAAENLLYYFFRCGEKTLRGFVYSLKPGHEGPAWFAPYFFAQSFFRVKATPTTLGPALAATAAPIW